MSEYSETAVRGIFIENDANKMLNELKKEKTPQCCFKKRLVDGFLIGACRALKKDVRPTKLDKKNLQKKHSVNFPDLKDVDSLMFYLKVIAYAHNLKEAGYDEQKLKDVHKILIDSSMCIELAEKYFKGGWIRPYENSFAEICESDEPDTSLFNDFDYTEWTVDD